MENAIDAGADALTVEIQHGGMSLIRVTDNGCGIAAAEAETAFLRHATSKLRTEYDLEAIGTLGFRGEALAAISAVSRIELLTRTAEEDLGAALSLEGARWCTGKRPAAPRAPQWWCATCSTTPRPAQVPEKDAAEGAACFAMVQRVALSHPEVSVKFLRDGKQELLTPGDGQVQSALYAVLGRDMALGFTPVKGSGEDMSVSGFVSLPTCCRGTRGYQHFFVNGRYVKSRTMMAALEEAYANQKMVGKFPGCVLHLTTRLNAVDVNVHPTKQEVKFGSDKKVFDAVYYAVKSTLEADRTRPSLQVEPPRPARGAACAVSPPPGGAAPAAPTYREMTLEEFRRTAERPAAPLPLHDFTAPRATGAAPAAPAGNGVSGAPISIPQSAGADTHIRPAEAAPVPAESGISAPPTSAAPHARTDDRARPAESAPASGAPISTVRPVGADAHIRPAEAAPDQPVGAAFMAARPAGEPSAPPSEEEPWRMAGEEPWRMAGEVLNTYIIVEQGDKVLFIDKHAAHERLNFDRMKAEGYQPMVQALLEPVVFTPPAEEGAALLAQLPLLGRFGFEAEDFGGGALIVRAAPQRRGRRGDPPTCSPSWPAACSPAAPPTRRRPGTSCSTPWPARRPSRAARGTAPPSCSRWPRRSCPARSNIAPTGGRWPLS